MRKILLFAIISIIIFSCHKDYNKNTFDKFYEIKGEEIFNNDFEVFTLFAVDSILLVQLRENTYNFAVYNPKTLKCIYKFAKKGEGPDEFSDYLLYEHYIIEDNQLKVWLYGINVNKVYLINISEGMSKNKTVIETVLRISPQQKFSRLYVLDPNKIIGNNRNTTINMNRFVIYNPKNDSVIRTVEPFPPTKLESNDLAYIFYRYNYLYKSSFEMKPDKSKFVSAMEMFNRIDIFDNNGNFENSYIDENNITERQIDVYLSEKEDILKTRTVKYYYRGAFASNNYIYTLYYNQLKSDYSKKSIPVKIRIFNWKAEPICEIKVPDYLTSFTIDEKNGIMYGIAYYDEKILKYDIKPILDEIR